MADAVAYYSRKARGIALRAPREAAGLTQTELAGRLSTTQSMVSRAESGAVCVGERYLTATLKACKLAEDWPPPRQSKAST